MLDHKKPAVHKTRFDRVGTFAEEMNNIETRTERRGNILEKV